MIENYGINDIQTLDFISAVRAKIAMYLGSADMQGVYNAIQEIISNSVDEFYMGYGDRIDIVIKEGNEITITDYARGVPFGIKEDGSNVLVDIYSRAHTGGKFNDKVYNSVAGLNGIGAKATCLSSLRFTVVSTRDSLKATAKFEKGQLIEYKEEKNNGLPNGTTVNFIPDAEVYNLEPIKVDYEVICNKCKNLSYLAKGLTFNILHQTASGKIIESKQYCAKDGILDLIREKVKNPVHPTPIYYKMKEDGIELDVAFQWTKDKEDWYVFTNGLHNTEGGTPLTGMKTAFTNFMKKQFKGEFSNDMARTGLVYAVSCKVPNPSFANQTKTKVNNTELRGMAQRAVGQALADFQQARSAEFKQIIDFLAKERKAEAAAERARKQVLEAQKEIEKNQRRKVFASNKLKDAEFLGENSTLLIVEGDSAMGGMAQARDYTKFGILAIRGKIINCFSNPQEKIYENEEIKLLLSAMNIVPGKYNASKLRYGKIAICTDADSDGGHIGLLIMAALQYLAPEFLAEGRLYWLRSPLYIVNNKKEESYYFTDQEFNAVRATIKGEVTRAKGLGELEADTARRSMFSPEYQRLEPLELDDGAISLLEDLMGDKVEPRKEFIFNKIDFSEVKE